MTKVTFIEQDGTRHEVDARDGQSLMQAAVDNMVPGIIAECGGSCACATCHVYVEDEASRQRLPPRSNMEADVVSIVEEPRETSRLSCQIEISPELDGLEVHLPAGLL